MTKLKYATRYAGRGSDEYSRGYSDAVDRQSNDVTARWNRAPRAVVHSHAVKQPNRNVRTETSYLISKKYVDGFVAGLVSIGVLDKPKRGQSPGIILQQFLKDYDRMHARFDKAGQLDALREYFNKGNKMSDLVMRVDAG